jgi:hypothetical protein
VSIDGVVLCDCFEAGRALPPPCPVVRREPYFYPAPGYERLDSEVRAWEWTACEHPGGCLVDQQLTRQFLLRAMAEYGGADEFPATHAAMPDGSGAETTPEESARCLAEFDRLAALMADRTMAAIVNADDDRIVFVAARGPMDIDRYLFGVSALRELFEASVRTGRRIYWV